MDTNPLSSLRWWDIRHQTSEDLAGKPTFDLLIVIVLNCRASCDIYCVDVYSAFCAVHSFAQKKIKKFQILHCVHFCPTELVHSCFAEHVHFCSTEHVHSCFTEHIHSCFTEQIHFQCSHYTALCKACHFHLRSLRHIRRSLTDNMAILIAVALVQSRLDYCNSLFFNMSCFNINKLQHVQNLAARLALNDWRSPTQQILVKLHWLSIQSRIKFKICTLTSSSSV